MADGVAQINLAEMPTIDAVYPWSTPTKVGGTVQQTPTNMQYGLASVGALSGLANAYSGLQMADVAKKNAELAKKAFAFNSAMDNKNLLNQGKAYNTALYQRGDIAAAGGGLTQEQRDAKIAGLKKSEFDTTAIQVG